MKQLNQVLVYQLEKVKTVGKIFKQKKRPLKEAFFSEDSKIRI